MLTLLSMNIETAKFITNASNKSQIGKAIGRTRQSVSSWPEDKIPDDAQMRVLRAGGFPEVIDTESWLLLRDALEKIQQKNS